MPPLLRLLPPAKARADPTALYAQRSSPRMSKSASRYLDISAWENEEDEEDEEEDELDDEANLCPRSATGGEGSAEGSRAKAHQQGPSSAVSKVVWRIRPPALQAGRPKMQDFPFGPFATFMWKLPAAQDVRLRLPPSHTNLVPQIVPVPMEEMEPFAQPSDIPVHSWVRLLTSGLKNEIAYVKRVEGDSVYLLVVPWNLPYISGGENSAAHRELFDVDLARQHGLEVILTPSPEGRTIAHCLQSQYHCGLLHRRFQRRNVEPVSLPTPEQIAWFVVSDVDPTLVARTLTRFSAQKWQVGDCGKIQAGEFVNEVAYCHDGRPSGDSVDIIAGPHRGFEGMVLSVDVIEDMALLCGNSRTTGKSGVLLSYPNRDPHDQLRRHPPVEEHFIEPGDAGTSKRHSTTKMPKGDKGKSKAQVPEVPSKDSDSDGADDEEVIIVSLDDIQVTARPTLQFSKEKGWDVSKGDLIQVILGSCCRLSKELFAAVDLITATLTLESEDRSMVMQNNILDVKYGSSQGPNKGYSGTLRSVGRTSVYGCNPFRCHDCSKILQLPPAPLHLHCQAKIPQQIQVQATPGSPLPDDVNPQRRRCMSWLFDNDFCNFSKWHVCLRVRLAYNHGTLGKEVWRGTSWACVSYHDLKHGKHHH
ncbi:hypothetical protein BKA82DRAFT_4020336 [Pisolithus tinctorius]|nr:hypothetical protein BKA82DRAFT_4020336 [Pisolithus tinctorius]